MSPVGLKLATWKEQNASTPFTAFLIREIKKITVCIPIAAATMLKKKRWKLKFPFASHKEIIILQMHHLNAAKDAKI